MTPFNETATGGYETFFGLKETPFSLAPDPRFLFAAASHSAALAEIGYAIDRREPIVVVTGEIGTGKTLLCRTVLRRLPRKTFVSVVDDPLLGPDELLRQLLEDFGVIHRDRTESSTASRHELVDALQAFLRSLGSIQAHAVVIIDEAQHLQPAVLEQIRLLSNIDDERGTLLQIILVGQSDVEPLLSRPELRQIQQRVSRRFRLLPLTHGEVAEYINHRLQRAREGAPASGVPGAAELARALADWDSELPSVRFDPSAVEAISAISGGVPRTINLLCDRSLEHACKSGVRAIDAATVHAAAGALGLEVPAVTKSVDHAPVPEPLTSEAPRGRTRVPVRLAAAAVLIGAAAVGAWLGLRALTARQATPPPPATSPAARAVTAPPTRPPAAAPASTTPPTSAASQPATPRQAPVASLRSPATAPAPAPAAPPDHAGFDIVVASFKTESRAAEVQSELEKLGVRARRRSTGAWQQVIAGPYASRDDASQAQQTLVRGGYGGTQIVPASR